MNNSAAAAPALFSRWFKRDDLTTTGGEINYLIEDEAMRTVIWDDFLSRVRSHYLDPVTLASFCDELGYDEAAKHIEQMTPTQTKSRSGDFGEILATEFVNESSSATVFIKRLRYKDERDTALRGDDLIGVELTSTNALHLLKGESKSAISMSTRTLLEAEGKLRENNGHPSPHSIAFIANRLIATSPRIGFALSRYIGKTRAADRLSHILIAVTQAAPKTIFPKFLKRPYLSGISRRLVAIVIKNHKTTIASVFADAKSSRSLASQYTHDA